MINDLFETIKTQERAVKKTVYEGALVITDLKKRKDTQPEDLQLTELYGEDKYIVQLRFATAFFATEGTLQDNIERAKATIKQEIYQDVHESIRVIKDKFSPLVQGGVFDYTEIIQLHELLSELERKIS